MQVIDDRISGEEKMWAAVILQTAKDAQCVGASPKLRQSSHQWLRDLRPLQPFHDITTAIGTTPQRFLKNMIGHGMYVEENGNA